ncbi:unnamed protein product, partial [Closterium sp. NIES-53]
MPHGHVPCQCAASMCHPIQFAFPFQLFLNLPSSSLLPAASTPSCSGGGSDPVATLNTCRTAMWLGSSLIPPVPLRPHPYSQVEAVTPLLQSAAHDIPPCAVAAGGTDAPTHMPHMPSHVPNPPPHMPHMPSHVPNPPTHMPHMPSHVPNPPPHMPHMPSHVPNPPTHMPHMPSHMPNPPTHMPHMPSHVPNPPPHMPHATGYTLQPCSQRSSNTPHTFEASQKLSKPPSHVPHATGYTLQPCSSQRSSNTPQAPAAGMEAAGKVPLDPVQAPGQVHVVITKAADELLAVKLVPYNE